MPDGGLPSRCCVWARGRERRGASEGWPRGEGSSEDGWSLEEAQRLGYPAHCSLFALEERARQTETETGRGTETARETEGAHGGRSRAPLSFA